MDESVDEAPVDRMPVEEGFDGDDDLPGGAFVAWTAVGALFLVMAALLVFAFGDSPSLVSCGTTARETTTTVYADTGERITVVTDRHRTCEPLRFPNSWPVVLLILAGLLLTPAVIRTLKLREIEIMGVGLRRKRREVKKVASRSLATTNHAASALEQVNAVDIARND